MPDEKQILHIWKSATELLQYPQLKAGYRMIHGSEEGFADAVSILQCARYIDFELGEFSITKKGWKIRAKTPPPVMHSKDDVEIVEALTPHAELLTSINRRISAQPEVPEVVLTQQASPWHWFRRLVAYYIDCVRCDERPSNVLYHNGENDSFIPILLSGFWWPTEVRQEVSLSIPTRSGQNAFLRRVVMEEDFFMGYPFHILGEGDKRVVIPVFCIPVSKINYEHDRLDIELDFDHADVNSSWLEKRFRTNEEKRRFLQRCGLVDDEDSLGDLGFNFTKAVNTLKIFAERYVQEDINALVTEPIVGLSNKVTGIYNSAVLFAGKKLRFNVGLIKELEKIRQTPDEELERSALKYIFCDTEANDSTPSLPSPEVADPAIPFVPYNYEQEQAINQAFKNDLTVITGPPGTGKSQVVVNLLANLAVRGKTAIFASKNHKAIDAVIPRTNSLIRSGTLISRLKNPDTGEVFTWEKAIKSVMAATGLPFDENCESLKNETFDILRKRDRLLQDAELWGEEERQLSGLNEQFEASSQEFLPSQIKMASQGDGLAQDGDIQWLKKAANSVPGALVGLFSQVRCLVWAWTKKPGIVKCLKRIGPTLAAYHLEIPAVVSTEAFKSALGAGVAKLEKINTLFELQKKISIAEANTKEIKPLTDCAGELLRLLEYVSSKTTELLEKSVANRFSMLKDCDLRKLQQLSGIVSSLNNAGVGPQAHINWTRFFHESFSDLLKFFPLWAVPNLSVRHGVPLISGIVDTVIIDEASQCDVASIIPLFFRARSAVIVGDPQQLKPVHTLSKNISMQLLRRHKLIDEVSNLSYEYRETSCFLLAASSPRCGGKVQLKDHYRCHQDIALYFNEQFYGKTLRVITNRSNLCIPKNYKPGVMWTEVQGSAVKTGASGAICQTEIDAVANEVHSLLVDRQFEGTVGVVTPFRVQANRIMDAVSSKVPAELLNRASFVSSTADGFQGDERDVILLSSVYQSDMYEGGKWYITSPETRNLWNVAVSRARAALHVFGNKEACRQSGAAHLVALAKRSEAPSEEIFHTGHFDSVWERNFYDALKDADIDTISQYPLVGKRLDLAVPIVKMDIEIDGEKYHRDASGRRKGEDLWRDMTVRAAGWEPVRFWVYELRENMKGCVDKVRQLIADRQTLL